MLVLVGVSRQPGMWRGVTSFVAAGDGVRILRVTLNARLLADEQLRSSATNCSTPGRWRPQAGW